MREFEGRQAYALKLQHFCSLLKHATVRQWNNPHNAGMAQP